MKTSLIYSAALLLASMAFGAEKADAKKPPGKNGPLFKSVQPATPSGVSCITNVIATYNGLDIELVVYVPEQAAVFPAILDIHGGGWSARQVKADKPMMERLATNGFVTALVAYRLSGDAKYPAALNDCKSAVRYLRANAAKFKLDPDRIGVMGGSAGGHLSGLLAMTDGKPEFEGDGPHKEFSSRVKACVVMAGTQDFATAYKDHTSDGAVAFFGSKCSDNPALYQQASPITHVRAGVPPVIFIEGEKDTLKVGRAEMQDKLRALGIETAVHTLKDAPHPFWMSQPWLDQTVEISAAFFKKHLGAPKPKG
jgi:acetyl esterase/lipase